MSDYQGPCVCLKTAEEIIQSCSALERWALRLLQRHPALDSEIIETLEFRVDSEVIEPVEQFARCLRGRSGEDYQTELESLPISGSTCHADEHVDIGISYEHLL